MGSLSEKDTCDQDITVKEILISLIQLYTCKTPGKDGLPLSRFQITTLRKYFILNLSWRDIYRTQKGSITLLLEKRLEPNFIAKYRL